MKKLITLFSSILLASSISTVHIIAQDFQINLTPEQTEMMIERTIAMVKAQQKDECKDSGVAKCLGISENKCEKVSQEITEECTIPLIRKSIKSGQLKESMAMELEKQTAKCSIKIATKNSIDPKKFLSCVDKQDPDAYDEDSSVREMIENR